jgi:GT2 family glycosyltransferase
MNPVLMLVHNNLEATKRAIESVWHQDIDNRHLVVIDNDSNHDIRQWLVDCKVCCPRYSPQIGVTKGWNIGLEAIFEFIGCEHCLVLNNDIELGSDFYQRLLDFRDEGVAPSLVSGNSTPDRSAIGTQASQPSFNPDFSAFLLRRNIWTALGGFDDSMIHYASDNDFHVRAHRSGWRLVNSGIAFYHERSSTMRVAESDEQYALSWQADKDRQVFKAKWGCEPWEAEKYDALFK